MTSILAGKANSFTAEIAFSADNIFGGLRNFDEDIRLNESDCEESKESADVIDDIPVNPDIYVAREEHTEWIPYNSNDPGRFATRNVLRQSSGSMFRET
ncbi:uncharacterized protein TNCV_2874161 [Trichonephila clavipes]|nr:uncharacterized protein TNCV_2874161 [Trichonephila clavipes]